MSDTPTDPRLIYAPEAAPNWSAYDERVTTIHLGTPGSDKTLSLALPPDLATRFPHLTHLRLWNVDVTELPPLPVGLQCLEIVKCPSLTHLPPLPASLEELLVDELPELNGLKLPASFPALWDISLKGGTALPQKTLEELLARSPALRWLDLSRCAGLTAIKTWPATLEKVILNDCPNLKALPVDWPPKLRRLDVKGSAGLASLGEEPLPPCMDYLDLRETTGLSKLPPRQGHPRTLLIHGSGLKLPNELFGEKEDHNTADAVWAHLDSQRSTEHEVKLILLGNGRAGKSSLARRLVHGDFDPQERSTHGIRLWQWELPFGPVDEPGSLATVKLHVWDFAGQDLYHNAHRMFLQSKAIFLLCDTAAGDGADPETDATDSDDLPPGWDVDRTLHYWRGQVEALGSAPGRQGPAPMLVIRTKCDRDAEKAMEARLSSFANRMSEAGQGLEKLAFSAKTGAGVEELKRWVSEQAAQVLGAKGKRELTLGALRVKAELMPKMIANEAAYHEAETAKAVAKPPHPTLPMPDAHALIRRLCAEETYGQRPELLLELLHLSGFLFYKPEHLPDEVILDQRWVIQGMYAAFDRTHSWPKLVALKGCVLAEELKLWGWSQHGYTEAEQGLFLRFMESCGMAYPVGERNGRQEYVVPRALPAYSTDLEREAGDYRRGLSLEKTVVLDNKFLSRDSVLELLVRLGREWGRSPVLWLWGGQFESYRRWHREEDRPPTFLHLNWQPKTPESYGGTLTLNQYGQDDSFLAAVLEECRKLGGFREVEVPVIPVPKELQKGFDGLRLPAREVGDAGSISGHKRPASHASLVEVGISFAGDQKAAVKDWKALPADSIECWPLALAAFLRAHYGFKVEEYRTEQARDPHQQEPGRKGYLDRLVSKDFMFVFISNAYLRSPWCMYEFLKIFERCDGGGCQRTDLARCGRFKEAMWSQTALEGEDPLVAFQNYWLEWYQKFKRTLDERVKSCQARFPDINAHDRELAGWAYADWARCVADAGKFDAIKQALNSGGWTHYPIPERPSDESLKEWAQALSKSTERQMYLFERAEAAWKASQHDRAQRLFIHGFLGSDPDGQPEGLDRALDKQIGPAKFSTLNDIRRSVLEEYRVLIGQGRVIRTWQELAEAVAPESGEPDESEPS